MTTTHWISECYREVPTDVLAHMLDDATERAEYTPDREEKELWKERLEGMKEELLRRQDQQEQIEVWN
ncbi:hypothetical protein L0244_27455 [bacterium]|nr:hypothetical protein [bacterium]MCI0616734.1 hypothetical protein [bacterium]